MRRRWSAMVVAWVACAALAACGDEETDEGGGTRPDDPCASAGSVSGVRGRVVAPSCSTFVSSPTVTLLDALQFEVATATGDEFGEFSFSTAQLKGDGDYVILVEKGPYRGPDQPTPFRVMGGQSEYQIVKLGTGGGN